VIDPCRINSSLRSNRWPHWRDVALLVLTAPILGKTLVKHHRGSALISISFNIVWQTSTDKHRSVYSPDSYLIADTRSSRSIILLNNDFSIRRRICRQKHVYVIYFRIKSLMNILKHTSLAFNAVFTSKYFLIPNTTKYWWISSNVGPIIATKGWSWQPYWVSFSCRRWSWTSKSPII